MWRVCGQLRLNLPRRTKQWWLTRPAQALVVRPHPNAVWALDFMSDTLYGVDDDFGRATFWMKACGKSWRLSAVDTLLLAERVIRVLEQVKDWRGQPLALQFDDGPELIAECFMTGCAERAIELRYIQRTYRTEVLTPYVFDFLEQVKEISEEWL